MGYLKKLLNDNPPRNCKEYGEMVEMYPEYFKVCIGCDTPLNKDLDSAVCPFCGVYNFDNDPAVVKTVGKKMQSPDCDSWIFNFSALI